jgi:hypothetical protein
VFGQSIQRKVGLSEYAQGKKKDGGVAKGVQADRYCKWENYREIGGGDGDKEVRIR